MCKAAGFFTVSLRTHSLAYNQSTQKSELGEQRVFLQAARGETTNNNKHADRTFNMTTLKNKQQQASRQDIQYDHAKKQTTTKQQLKKLAILLNRPVSIYLLLNA